VHVHVCLGRSSYTYLTCVCVCVNQLNPPLLCSKTACSTLLQSDCLQHSYLLQSDCLLHYVRSPASKDAHRHGFASLRRRFDHHRPVLDLAFWFLGHRAYISGILGSQHTSAYVSIRQHTSAYASIELILAAYELMCCIYVGELTQAQSFTLLYTLYM
jgi:hypothetical protein